MRSSLPSSWFQQIILLFCFALHISLVSSFGLTVNCSAGLFNGILSTNYPNVASFLGIPYAQAPVGELRFKAPVPLEKRFSSFNAKSYGSVCMQPDYIGSLNRNEDCLQLNIWTPFTNPPLTNSTPSAALLPVLVFIHGSLPSSLSQTSAGSSAAFLRGSGALPEYAGDSLVDSSRGRGGIIVVNFNYRLGIFGWGAFASDAEGVLAANAGLADQVLALNWVQENIAAFGGDPDRVTLFGQGSGAISVGLHLVLQDSQTLFKNAILVSGSIGQGAEKPAKYKPSLLKDQVAVTSKILTRGVCSSYCPDPTNFTCAQSISADVLLSCQNLFSSVPSPQAIFQPVVDGFLLSQQPFTLLSDSFSFNPSRSILMGNVRDEGTAFVDPKTLTMTNVSQDYVTQYFSQYFTSDQNDNEIITTSDAYITPGLGISGDVIATIAGDYYFQCATRRSLALMEPSPSPSNAAPRYLYSFEHIPSWFRDLGLLNFKVRHGSDLPFVFGQTSLFPFTSSELKLVNYMQSVWVDFVLDGDIDTWSKWDSRTQPYMFLDMNKQFVNYKWRDSQCNLFDVVTYPGNGGSIAYTKTGLIRGTLDEFVNAFLGVPYARPPVGPLRFQAPQPAESWGLTVKNTTAFGAACMQDYSNYPYKFGNVSEDCLTLNIWTSFHGLTRQLRPVLVFVHGGGFLNGGSNLHGYNGFNLAKGEGFSSEKMPPPVVVTFNYRLGVFGWGVAPDADDDDLNSNFGLLDQQLAFKWIFENIVNFGGDNSRITLFGDDVGSLSISLHLLIRNSTRYFTRVALQSYTAFQGMNRLYSVQAAVDLTNKIYNQVSCEYINSGCIQNVSADQLLRAQSQVLARIPITERAFSPFAPIADKKVLLADPYVLLVSGAFSSLQPLLIGNVADEGSRFVRRFGVNLQFPDMVLILKNFFGENVTSRILESPSSPYIFNLSTTSYLAKVFGDYMFNCPIRRFSRTYIDFQPPFLDPQPQVYKWRFSHIPSFLAVDSMNKVLSTSETWFLFGLPPLSSMSFSPAEVTVSHEMQGNWTAFATTGIVDDFLPWKPLAPDFVDIRTAISKNEGVPASNPECDFWDSFTPNPIVSLLVPTENGIIIGSQNGFVLEFKGIPYAAPPIGDFRFMPPQPAPSWIPTSRPAVDFGPSCLQPPSSRFPADQQSEDCLSLNVFVPDGTYVNSSLPVLVWIHGGAFRSGGSSAYDAELLTVDSLKQHAIVVTINYRLGIFGWSFFSNGTVPLTNFGLLDQQYAIQWVQRNIRNFGGNPNDIVLFGESAGSISISLHLVIPTSRVLFARAILSSGTALQGASGPAIGEFAPYNATALQMVTNNILRTANCDYRSQTFMQCARGLNATKLLSAQMSTFSPAAFHVFQPVIDGFLITDDPVKLTAKLKARFGLPHHSVLVTNVLDEGTAFVSDLNMTLSNVTQMVHRMFGETNGDFILKSYMNASYISDDRVTTPGYLFAAILGDYQFVCPSRRLLRLVDENYHRDGVLDASVNLYRWVFEHVPSWISTAPEYAALIPDRVFHGCDVPFVFGRPPSKDVSFTPAEIKLSTAMKDAIISFVRSSEVFLWPKWTLDSMQYLAFDVNLDGPDPRQHFRDVQCDLWDKLTLPPDPRHHLQPDIFDTGFYAIVVHWCFSFIVIVGVNLLVRFRHGSILGLADACAGEVDDDDELASSKAHQLIGADKYVALLDDARL